MNQLNEKYIGKNVEYVKENLIKDGYNINIKKMEPKRDADILTDELVVQIKQKQKDITLMTSMFNKYV